MNFGQAVRASRLSRKLTQSDLATLAGVSRQAIVLLESNSGRVSTLCAVHAHAPFRIRGLPAGNTFGERIRAARGDRSIAEVAHLSCLATNTVRAIESDGGTVSSLSKIILLLAPHSAIEPVIQKPKKVWRTVHGKANPDRDVADYYATPAPIARLLLDHEQFIGNILEPCVGEARVIETVLRERGHVDVHCFDLMAKGEEQCDFFDITERYDSIVTNPPFNRHVDFVQHAKVIAKEKIALLLPLNCLTGKQRHADIREDTTFPLARVLILNRGVNFLAPDPYAKHVQPSQLYIAWFIFERSHQGPPTLSWIDSHALIERKPVRTSEASVPE